LRVQEQGALRRIATLVARGVPPEEVFSAVAGEAGTLLGAASTRLYRFEADGTATVVTDRSAPGTEIPVGTRLSLDGENVPAIVLRTRRPARMSSFGGAHGPLTDVARRLGIRSAVGAPIVVEGRIWGALVVAWTTETEQSADTMDRLAEFTELVATAIANADTRAELTASRARVVAASDETRQRIERDLHDGAQQRLISLGLELRTAATTLPSDQHELRARLSETTTGLNDVVQDLQEMSRGIHPAILSKGGLGPALRTLARRSAVPVELDAIDDRRLPAPVEVASYYVVAEALTNVAKHAQASVVHIALEVMGDVTQLSIRDDGVGGADPRAGTGLIGLRDRVEAIGGTIEIQSPPGDGTSLLVTFAGTESV
jgi:signal transduction histidine kinase